MSVEGFAAVPNWMIRDDSISRPAICVYTALASHSGKGGIHPSVATLAAESRYSDNMVRAALAELRKLGVVKVHKRTTRQGDSDTNSYTLHPNGRRGGSTVEVPPAAGEGGVVQRLRDGGSTTAPEEEPRKKNPSRTPPDGGGATRIPDPFIVTAAMREWAADEVPGVDVDGSTRFFVDFWRAATRNALKKDWVATWRNWLRKDYVSLLERRGPRMSKTDRARSVVEMARRMEGGPSGSQPKEIGA